MKKLLLFFCLIISLHGYSKDIRIHGSIVDSINLSSISYATIQIFDANNNNVFNAVLQDTLGMFDFRNISLDDNGYMVIHHLGYEKKTVNIDAKQRTVNLGQIKMKAVGFMLSGVSVVAERKDKFMPDKAVYFVDSAMLANVDYSVELLKKIPQVSANELTNTVSIQGHERTLVLINGVNTGTSIDIRLINPNDILNIEVITAPSSGVEIEYDGIINIVLKEEPRKGVSGNSELTVMLNGRRLDAYAGVVFGFEKVRINLAYRNYYRAYAYNSLESRTNTMTQETYQTNSYADRPWELDNEIKLNVDYYLNTKHYFNLSTTTNFSNSDKLAEFTPSITRNNITENLTKYTSQWKNDYFVGNYTLFYKYKLQGEDHSLTTNFNLNVMTTDEDASTLYESGDMFVAKEHINKLAYNLKIDYTNALTNWLKIYAGIQGYNQNFKGVLNNNLANNNHFDELRYNGFVDFYAALKGFSLRLGVKMEENRVNFKNSTIDPIVHQSLTPSLVLTKPINNNSSVRAIYRRLSYYPSAWLLSPYTTQYDSLTIYKGNPSLKPYTRDVLQLTYAFWKSNFNFTTTLFYNNYNNLFSTYKTYDDDLVSTARPMNIAQTKTYGINMSGSVDLFDFININAGTYFYRRIYSVDNVERSNLFFSTNFNVTIYLPWQMSIGTMGSFSTKQLTMQGYDDPQHMIDAVYIMKKIKNFELVFALWGVSKSDEISYLFNDNFVDQSVFHRETRTFAFRLKYSFNTGKKYNMERIETLHETDKK